MNNVEGDEIKYPHNKINVLSNLSKHSCLIVGEELMQRDLKSIIDSNYDLIFKGINERLQEFLRVNLFSCLIVQLVEEQFEYQLKRLIAIKKSFLSLPIIIIHYNKNLELVRQIGVTGVNYIVSSENISDINNVLANVVDRSNYRIRIENFNIKLDQCTRKTKSALLFIEQSYPLIMSTREISDELEIAEASLSREFKKSGLLNPKRILMLFKIKHSIKLMTNSKLKLKEITYQSGFSNERRFNECFWRVMGCSPSTYRDRKF